jgi:hypothetical protein
MNARNKVFKRLRCYWMSAITVTMFSANNLLAELPVVEFNADHIVECRDVTPKGYSEKYPDKKQIEMVLRISAKLIKGVEADLDYLDYKIYDKNKSKSLYLSDYMPRTQLNSDIIDPIAIVEWQGSSSSTKYQVVSKKDKIEASTKIDFDKWGSSRLDYRRLPAQQLLTASGIAERGYGVFFKLKPYSQHTLEGDRSFSCIFTVPQKWRGDNLTVRCESIGIARGYLWDSKMNVGSGGFEVGLYLEADAEAEKIAKQVADSQQKILNKMKALLERKQSQQDWMKKVISIGFGSTGILLDNPGPSLVYYFIDRYGYSFFGKEIEQIMENSQKECDKAKAKLNALNGN